MKSVSVRSMSIPNLKEDPDYLFFKGITYHDLELQCEIHRLGLRSVKIFHRNSDDRDGEHNTDAMKRIFPFMRDRYQIEFDFGDAFLQVVRHNRILVLSYICCEQEDTVSVVNIDEVQDRWLLEMIDDESVGKRSP